LTALAMHTESEKQDRIMMESERESSSRKRLLSIKPKPIQLPEMASV
jgi:hypothetical protein